MATHGHTKEVQAKLEGDSPSKDGKGESRCVKGRFLICTIASNKVVDGDVA